MAEIRSVETEGEYIHVRFRDPDRYETIRTPDWAKQPAESVSNHAEVRTGKQNEGDDWDVQSVLIKKPVGEETAREQAKRIVDEIESRLARATGRPPQPIRPIPAGRR